MKGLVLCIAVLCCGSFANVLDETVAVEENGIPGKNFPQFSADILFLLKLIVCLFILSVHSVTLFLCKILRSKAGR